MNTKGAMKIPSSFLSIVSGVCLALFAPVAAVADADLFDPFTGFRIAQYRAPVPAPPPGTDRVDAAGVVALRESGAVLLDVHPLRLVAFDKAGNWILPDEHLSLPGAVWLPVVGWGNVEAWAQDYLTETLAVIASDGVPVIVFCQLDCWLSWNAVRRVNDLGYRALWFPGGVDEWAEAGHPLVPIIPRPVN